MFESSICCSCVPTDFAEREEARKLLLNLRLDLREIIDSVEKNRKFKMFMHPVSPEDAPDYYEKIENPMDVENIRESNIHTTQLRLFTSGCDKRAILGWRASDRCEERQS